MTSGEICYMEGAGRWVGRALWTCIWLSLVSLGGLIVGVALSGPDSSLSETEQRLVVLSAVAFAVFVGAAAYLYGVKYKTSIVLTKDEIRVVREQVPLTDLESPVAWGRKVSSDVRDATSLIPLRVGESIRALGGQRRGAIGQGLVTVRSRSSGETLVVHSWRAERLGEALASELSMRDAGGWS